MTELLKNKWMILVQATMILFTALVMVAAVHPDARSAIRNTLVQDYRVLVSSVDMEFNGEPYTIAKFKTRHSLVLEIYKKAIDGSSSLIQSFEMPEARDGYFNFDGSATNLALADIDQDGRLEILAPSFDRDLVGRLNIFRFSPEAGAIEKIVN